jgi:hypothetical protein
VGTWAAAWWAIRFYEKHGFRLVTQEEKTACSTPTGLSRPPGGNLGGLADPKWLALGSTRIIG